MRDSGLWLDVLEMPEALARTLDADAGVADADIRHALRLPIRIFRLDDLTMVIGSDRASRFLEVGIVVMRGVEVVIHAMPARAKFLR